MSFAVSEIVLSQELSNIIDVYPDLKINTKRLITLCIFAAMSLAISSKLSYTFLLTTLLFVTATLIFLTVTMQNTIHNLQRNLFAICYKQLNPSPDNDHYQGEEPVVQ